MQALGGGLARAAGERADGGVDDVGACLDALHVGHECHASGGVRVHDNRHVAGQRVLQSAYQAIRICRGKDASHVLNADGLAAHVYHFLGQVHVHLARVHRAGGVADSARSLGARFDGSLDGNLQVVDVVQRVEDTNNVDTVLHRRFHETTHDVVGIMLVSQDVLTAQQHLQLGIRKTCLQLAQTLPRIFVQEAHAYVEGRSAPAFKGMVPSRIQLRQDGFHFTERHTRRDQALLRIAQHGFGKPDMSVSHRYPSSLG